MGSFSRILHRLSRSKVRRSKTRKPSTREISSLKRRLEKSRKKLPSAISIQDKVRASQHIHALVSSRACRLAFIQFRVTKPEDRKRISSAIRAFEHHRSQMDVYQEEGREDLLFTPVNGVNGQRIKQKLDDEIEHVLGKKKAEQFKKFYHQKFREIGIIPR